MQRIYAIPPLSPRERIQAQIEHKSSGVSQKKVDGDKKKEWKLFSNALDKEYTFLSYLNYL